jgi:hypothetical protein
MRARRVATGLVIVASILGVGWVMALIVTGHDNGALRILAVLPGAVGITLLRMFPREDPAEKRASTSSSASPSPELGAMHPAPVDIVDR